MKTVFDASFKYKPSFETDVRRTFERVRREQQSQSRRVQTAGNPAMTVKVLQLDQVKKGGLQSALLGNTEQPASPLLFGDPQEAA